MTVLSVTSLWQCNINLEEQTAKVSSLAETLNVFYNLPLFLAEMSLFCGSSTVHASFFKDSNDFLTNMGNSCVMIRDILTPLITLINLRFHPDHNSAPSSGIVFPLPRRVVNDFEAYRLAMCIIFSPFRAYWHTAWEVFSWVLGDHYREIVTQCNEKAKQDSMDARDWRKALRDVMQRASWSG